MDIDNNLLEKIIKIIGTQIGVPVSEDDVIYMLEELVSEIDRLEEELEDYKEYVKDNYKPLSTRELYDIDDSDFIEML